MYVNKLVKEKDLLEILDISRSTLYRYELEGFPKIQKEPGLAKRYNLDECINWIKQNRTYDEGGN